MRIKNLQGRENEMAFVLIFIGSRHSSLERQGSSSQQSLQESSERKLVVTAEVLLLHQQRQHDCSPAHQQRFGTLTVPKEKCKYTFNFKSVFSW